MARRIKAHDPNELNQGFTSIYIDDSLFLYKKLSKIDEIHPWLPAYTKIASALGVTFNITKSDPFVRRSFDYLGLHFDLRTMTIKPKIGSFKSFMEQYAQIFGRPEDFKEIMDRSNKTAKELAVTPPLKNLSINTNLSDLELLQIEGKINWFHLTLNIDVEVFVVNFLGRYAKHFKREFLEKFLQEILMLPALVKYQTEITSKIPLSGEPILVNLSDSHHIVHSVDISKIKPMTFREILDKKFSGRNKDICKNIIQSLPEHKSNCFRILIENNEIASNFKDAKPEHYVELERWTAFKHCLINEAGKPASLKFVATSYQKPKYNVLGKKSNF